MPTSHTPTPTAIRAGYGFVSYLLSSAALVSYLIWLVVPDRCLKILSLSEVFPQKYWAVAVPIYLGVAFVLLPTVVYPCLGLCITPEVDDIRHVVDPKPKFILNPGGKDVGDIAPCDVLSVLRSRNNCELRR